MATEGTRSRADVGVPFGGDWRLGLASGLVGGLAFGAVATVTEPAFLQLIVPALYGIEPPGDAVIGWIMHVLHGAVLGIAFAAVVGLTGLAGASAREQIGLSVLYALVVWLVLAVLVLPTWLALIGSTVAPSVPYVTGALLAGHAAYGAVVGVMYYAFDAPVDDDQKVAAARD